MDDQVARAARARRDPAADRLGRLALLVLVMATPANAATTVDDWAAEIRQASRRFGIPQKWIRDVMRVESGGRTHLNGQPITSPAGAMGLMQLMPGTWAEMRRIYDLGADPYDPHDNVFAGAAYLRLMFERFGYPGAIAAYNSGPGRFAEHLSTGRPLPSETMSYVERVSGSKRPSATVEPNRSVAARQSHGQPAEEASRELFFTRRTSVEPDPAPREAGLFVIVGNDHD